jgi:hypothetical protein
LSPRARLQRTRGGAGAGTEVVPDAAAPRDGDRDEHNDVAMID